MALKTLEKLIEHAQTLTTGQAQSAWVRSLKNLAPNNPEIRDIRNFVPGCEHPTWISSRLTDQGIEFDISCDGSDTQGVAGIVVEALGGLTVQEIRSTDFSEFRGIARYLNNRQQRSLNAMLNCVKNTIGHAK